jgi:UDP-N-acetylglucosamine 2-epimerase (non-hydrolysing)
MRTFLYVVGTRPNFMKIAPVLTEMGELARGDRHVLVHTGQHYDEEMSRIFFEDLELPQPDHYLGVGSGTHAGQTARVLEGLERILIEETPDLVIVPGDVNSTLAAALAAAKLRIPIAHVEAGLRSFDRTMPEEVNRVLTDQVSDHLLIHSPEAVDNLVMEGIDRSRIHFVGNTMIDTLVRLRGRVDSGAVLERLEIAPPYLLVTLHRPALVDGPLLAEALAALNEVGNTMQVVFPVHPRTRAAIEADGVTYPRVRLLPPAGYLEFLALEQNATAILTDSGGIQEEATFLGVRCFTLRDNTERPVTVSQGTNTLLGLRPDRIAEIPGWLRDPELERRAVPEGWDGNAGRRAAEILSSVGNLVAVAGGGGA